MTESLVTLPVELVERIVTSLETEETGTLRLVCRELCTKASLGTYLKLFTDRSVDVTEDGLHGLMKALSGGGLPTRLRNLTLVAVVFHPRTERMRSPAVSPDAWSPAAQTMLHREECPNKFKLSHSDRRFAARREVAELRLQQAKHQWNVESGVYFDLVAAAFESIKATCSSEGLQSLILSVAVQTSKRLRFAPDAMELRAAATEESQLLAVTMKSLMTSQLPVHHLDIFSSTRLCSLACTELAAWLNTTPASSLRSFGRQLSSLSISYCRSTSNGRVSADCCNCNGRRFRASGASRICHNHSCKFEEDDDEHCGFEGSLANFVLYFPALQSLDLHEYQTDWVPRDNEDCNTLVFDSLSDRAQLPILTSLKLRGINTTETSLLRFLSKLPELHRLELTHVNLSEGIWMPVFDYVKDKTKVQHFELTDLFEGKHGENLNGTGGGPGGGGGGNNPFGPPGLPPPPPPPPPGMFSHSYTPYSHGSYSNPVQTETYVNSLLSFRASSVPKNECKIDGCFGTNRVLLKGMWVAKAVLSYTTFTHSSLKAKVESRWDRERMREYGPTNNDVIIMD